MAATNPFSADVLRLRRTAPAFNPFGAPTTAPAATAAAAPTIASPYAAATTSPVEPAAPAASGVGFGGLADWGALAGAAGDGLDAAPTAAAAEVPTDAANEQCERNNQCRNDETCENGRCRKTNQGPTGIGAAAAGTGRTQKDFERMIRKDFFDAWADARGEYDPDFSPGPGRWAAFG